MNTSLGYSKRTLTNTDVLLSGGGNKPLSEFIGSISWDATNRKIKYTPVGGSVTDLVTLSSLAITNYLLPAAKTNALGGIIVSNALTTAVTLTSGNGTTANRYYGIQIDKNGKAFVNIPWTNTWNQNTATLAGYVTAPGENQNGKVWMTGSDGTPSWLNANNHTHNYLPTSGGRLSGDLSFKTSTNDSPDIVFLYADGTEKSRIWTDNTYSEALGPYYRVYDPEGNELFKGRLSISNHTHSYSTLDGLPTFYNLVFSNGTLDILTYDPDGSVAKKIIKGSNITFTVDGNNLTIAATDTWNAMTGATSSTNGTTGYVNAVPPKDGYNTKFLRADGTWSIPAYPTKASWNYDDKYVTALGTSGNYLTWTKNGTTNNITVPYASNADKVDGYHADKFFKLYTRAEIGTSPNFNNPKIGNAPVNGYFEIRTSNETTGESGSKPFNSFASFINITYSNTIFLLAGNSASGWKIRGRQTAGIETNGTGDLAWQTILTSANYSSYVKTMVKSGSNHAGGLVPDPGETEGITKFLREDGTWQVPNYPTKSSWNYNDMYVSSLTTNGNSLRWVKNGSNNDITIPYATSSGNVGGLAAKKFNIGGTGNSNVHHYYLIVSFTSTGLYSSWTIKLHIMSRTEGGEAQDYYVLIGGEYSSNTSKLNGVTAYTLDNYLSSGDHWYYNTSNGITNVYFYLRETWKDYTCTVVDYKNAAFTVSNIKLEDTPDGLVAFSHRLNITSANISSQSVSYATALTSTSIGSADQPVYFDAEGKPVACTSYANASVNYATSATKLQTAKTLWGQSFDGTKDISGTITVGDGNIILNNNKYLYFKDTNGSNVDVLRLNTNNDVVLGHGSKDITDSVTYITSGSGGIRFRVSDTTSKMFINSDGNIGINTASPSYKLDVNGTLGVSDNITMYTETTTAADKYSGLIMSVKDTTTGLTYSRAVIRGYQDHGESSTNGLNLVIHGGGNTFISSGESATNHYALYKGSTTERLYLTSDTAVYIQGNANTIGNRKGIAVSNSGDVVPIVADEASNKTSNLGTTSYRFTNLYIESINADGNIYLTTNNKQIYAKDKDGTNRDVLRLNGDNILAVGAGLKSIASSTGIYAGTNGFYVCTNGSTKRMFIDSSGNVGIGTVKPSEKLEVSGNIKATNLLITSINGVTVGNSPLFTDTTYNAGTLALYNAGTNTENRVWSASVLKSIGNLYLPLAGGTIASGDFGVFNIQRNHTTNAAAIGFKHYSTGTTVETMGYIGMHTKDGTLRRWNAAANTEYTILDSSNSSVSKDGETLTVKINGITQSLTNTDTAYSAGTAELLSAGTDTTDRVWKAKIIKDEMKKYVLSIVTGGTTYSPTNGVVTLPDYIVYTNENPSYLGASFLKAEYSQKAAQKYIEFWDSAGGWFNFMLGSLYVVNNVGIGTTLPSYKLHVSGTCAVDEGLYKRNADSHPLSLWRATDSNQKLDIYVHDVLAVLNASDSDGWSSFSFCTNGTEYVRFDGHNQYVGIGTTTPSEKLEVNGNIKATNLLVTKINGVTVGNSPKFTDTTYSNFVKSGSGAAAGLVPKPSTTANTTHYLREDGTWAVPPNTWRGIQNNLTSNSTTDSLSAAQGKVLNGKFANYLPLSGGTMSSGAHITIGSRSNNLGDLYSGGIELRELNYSTTSITDNYINAPGITFHWGGKWAHKLNLHSNDIFWDNSKIWHAANHGSGSGLDADLLDGYHASSFALASQNLVYYTIDASSLSTLNFYPVTFSPTDMELNCEIHSPNTLASAAYNQNHIHFLLTSCGWSDTPSRFIVLSLGNYDNNEVTIGAVGRGNYGGINCVWVRGGLTYRFRCNLVPTLRSSDYTNSGEKFTVGTLLSGDSNTAVSILWTNEADYRNITYVTHGIKSTSNIYAVNFYTTSDKSKKQNISEFSEHIRKFQLKGTEKWNYGVIAQEVEEMFREGEDGNMTVNYDSVLSYYIGLLENKVKTLEEKIRILETKQNKDV